MQSYVACALLWHASAIDAVHVASQNSGASQEQPISSQNSAFGVGKPATTPSLGRVQQPCFGIVGDGGGECVTILHEKIFTLLKEHPRYCTDVSNAKLVFANVDTMRQFCWPRSCSIKGENTFSGTCGPGHPAQLTELWFKAIEGVDPKTQRVVYFSSVNEQDWKDPLKLTSTDTVIEKYGTDVSIVDMDRPRSKNRPSLDVNILPPLKKNIQDKVHNGTFCTSKSVAARIWSRFGLSRSVDDFDGESCSHKVSCRERKYLAYFSGSVTHPVRRGILKLHNPAKGVITKRTWGIGMGGTDGFLTMMAQTSFALCPRGDRHYSLRITEALALGSVPVILDDDYTPPFRTNITDWAVLIKEADVEQVPEILQAIPTDRICSMIDKGQEVYQKYMLNMTVMVDSIIDLLLP